MPVCQDVFHNDFWKSSRSYPPPRDNFHDVELSSNDPRLVQGTSGQHLAHPNSSRLNARITQSQNEEAQSASTNIDVDQNSSLPKHQNSPLVSAMYFLWGMGLYSTWSGEKSILSAGRISTSFGDMLLLFNCYVLNTGQGSSYLNNFEQAVPIGVRCALGLLMAAIRHYRNECPPATDEELSTLESLVHQKNILVRPSRIWTRVTR